MASSSSSSGAAAGACGAAATTGGAGGGAAAAAGAGRGASAGRGEAEVGEHPLVEAVFGLEEGVDPLEEAAGFGPLDDPVVVGGGHRHDLLGPDRGPDCAQAGRVADRARGDDRALADHQPRDRGDRADAAGVGQREVSPGEIVGRQGVGPRLLDQRVVGCEELREALAAGVADDRNHQRAGAVLLLDVDGQAEVAGAVVDPMRLAVDVGEVVGHHRHVLGGHACDRVGDQVGERDAVAGLLELGAALFQAADREGAERGGGRNRAALVHVAGQGGRATPDRPRGGGRRGGSRDCGRRGGSRDCGRRGGSGDCRRRRGGTVAAACLGGEHVGLGDAAAARAAGQGGEIDALLGGHAPRDRRCMCAAIRRDRARGPLAEFRCTVGRGGNDRAGAHPRDHLPDADRLPRLGQDLDDRSAGRRGQLHVDLVGRDLDDRFALLDRVAHLDAPLEDRPLGDRLAAGRGDDVDRLAARGLSGAGIWRALGIRPRQFARRASHPAALRLGGGARHRLMSSGRRRFAGHGRGGHLDAPVPVGGDLGQRRPNRDGLPLGGVDLHDPAGGR